MILSLIEKYELVLGYKNEFEELASCSRNFVLFGLSTKVYIFCIKEYILLEVAYKKLLSALI